MKEVFKKIRERLEESGKVIYREPTVENPQMCSLIPTGEKDILVSKAIEIVNQVEGEIDKGNISDGYHTFNELYHHRAVLFSAICNANKDLAWKSKLHDDGTMYDGMFIVGIETLEGQATYHYDIEPYWDMFKVKELPKAPKWDGHTPNEAIRRIELLGYKGGWIPCSERLPINGQTVLAFRGHHIGDMMDVYTFYCNDGRDMWEDAYGYENSTDDEGITAWQPLPEPYKGE